MLRSYQVVTVRSSIIKKNMDRKHSLLSKYNLLELTKVKTVYVLWSVTC
jgi:hypothetical protein